MFWMFLKKQGPNLSTKIVMPNVMKAFSNIFNLEVLKLTNFNSKEWVPQVTQYFINSKLSLKLTGSGAASLRDHCRPIVEIPSVKPGFRRAERKNIPLISAYILPRFYLLWRQLPTKHADFFFSWRVTRISCRNFGCLETVDKTKLGQVSLNVTDTN